MAKKDSGLPKNNASEKQIKSAKSKDKSAKPKKTEQQTNKEKIIQAKNDELLINNNNKDIGKIMNEESKRRKRKKRFWLILLLLLLLFIIVATAILTYFIIANQKNAGKFALEVDVSGYLTDKQNNDLSLVSSGRYNYREGTEDNQNRQLKFAPTITANSQFRLDYDISNLSGTTYSYVILVYTEQEDPNFTIQYFYESDGYESKEDIPSDGIRFSSGEDISVSLIIAVKDTHIDNSQLSCNIVFTVII